MKDICVVSRYPNFSGYHIEGRGYKSKSDAYKHQKLFAERVKALDSVNLRLGFDPITETKKLYEIAEIIIPDDFFKD